MAHLPGWLGTLEGYCEADYFQVWLHSVNRRRTIYFQQLHFHTNKIYSEIEFYIELKVVNKKC